MTERLQSLQALRFIAAAMVVYCHAVEQAIGVTGRAGVLGPLDFGHAGAAGVDIFFVISGFVIASTGPLAQRRPTAKGFFWKRWTRVAPIFYVVSVAAIAVTGFHLNWPQTVGTVFFWPTLATPMVMPYLNPGWTLCFEMVFYSAVALVLLGGKVWRNAAIAGAVIAGLWFLRGQVVWNGMAMLANPIYCEFAAGMGLALISKRLATLPMTVGIILALSGFIVILDGAIFSTRGFLDGAKTFGDSIDFRRVVRYGVAATMIVAGGLVCERRIAKSAAWRWLARRGDASYSLYLAHGVTMVVLFSLWPLWPFAAAPAAVILVGMAVAFVAGEGLYAWVERPLLKAIRRLGKHRPADDLGNDLLRGRGGVGLVGLEVGQVALRPGDADARVEV